MKKKKITKTILFFSIVFFMILVSCEQLPLEPEEPITSVVKTLNYKPNSTFTTDDGVFFGTLDGNQEIQGNLYKLFYADTTEVTFYENGRLSSGTLASEQSIAEGENKLFFEAENSIFFFQNGELREIQSASDQPLDVGGNDIHFASGEIKFHENGVVREGILFQNITLGGHSYFSGDTISFDDQEMVVTP